jgi:hypothetical protein
LVHCERAQVAGRRGGRERLINPVQITRAEKIELGLIVLAIGGATALAKRLPDSLELGSLLAIAALALLGQGLLRDLWLLSKQRNQAGAAHQEEARCMCMESTVGLSGVFSGVVLTAIGVSVMVPVAVWAWPLAGTVVWGLGYAMKDLVIQWSPWKLRRVKDHGSILVRWR